MKTDTLITLLARNAGPAPRAVAARRLAPVALAGALASLLLALAVLGPVPAAMFHTPAPWIKLVYAALLAGAAGWLTARLARPVARLAGPERAVLAVLLAMGALGGLAWWAAPADLRMGDLMGHSWRTCPFSVLGLSLPALAGGLWAVRGLAPTRPRAAGPGQRGEPPPLPRDLAAGARVVVDGAPLQAWDAALAAWLFELAEALRQRGAALQTETLPAGLQAVLALAQPTALADNPAPDALRAAALPALPRGRAPSQAAITVAFFGEVLLALGRWLRGRSAMRGADVLQQLDLTGPRSLPIVLLSCALIGLMLAYMGGAQLGRIGAQNFLADVVTVGMVRELAGMMTGIILAGRVGRMM